MNVPKPLSALTLGVAILAFVACAAAFIPNFGGPPTPRTVVSLRGEAVRLFGSGLYREDSVFTTILSFSSTSPYFR